MTLQPTAPHRSLSAKVSAVEFWRFAFTVIVCLFHLEIYFGNQTVFPSGSSAVEFFFILAGFTMAMSAARYYAGHSTPMSTKEAHAKAVDFVKNKLKAIYPVLIVAILLYLVLTPAMPMIPGMTGTSKLEMFQNTEWEWLMLVGTPMGNQEGLAPIIPLWFLTALMVVGYLYTFAIYKKFDFIKFAAPAVGILFYIFFAQNAEKVLDFYLPMGFLNAAMVRGIAEMSFGVSIYFLYEYLSKKKLGIIWRSILSLAEVYAIFRFFQLTLFQPLGVDNFRRIPYIMIIVLLSFLNVTFLARGLNKLGGLWRKAGKLSLTMYLCHLPIATSYMMFVGTLKMQLMRPAMTSGWARALYEFLKGAGGFGANFKPIPLNWRDIVIYMPLVIIVSILVNLIIAAIKKFIAKPLYARYKKKLAEQERAEANEEVAV
ncbi:MAG: acyltransferase [Clostridiales bacterium]|nr:acyltransferase [Clostridiales bacterium]